MFITARNPTHMKGNTKENTLKINIVYKYNINIEKCTHKTMESITQNAKLNISKI